MGRSSDGRGNAPWPWGSGRPYAPAPSLSQPGGGMGPSGNWSMMMRNGRRPPQADAALAMPRAVAPALGALRQTFDPVAQQAVTGLPAHPFGSIQHNRRRPKRDDALEIPPRVKELRRVIATPLPRMRSEELRMTVDRWGGCPRAFTSRSDAPPRR